MTKLDQEPQAHSIKTPRQRFSAWFDIIDYIATESAAGRQGKLVDFLDKLATPNIPVQLSSLLITYCKRNGSPPILSDSSNTPEAT